MNIEFGIRGRSGSRTLAAGLLASILFVTVFLPTAMGGVAFEAVNFASMLEWTSEGSSESDCEQDISTESVFRTFRRIVRQWSRCWTQARELDSVAMIRIQSARFLQIVPCREHDRHNGFGAPMRC